MNLLSNTFAAFLIISLAFYYLCPKKIQWCCLLAANAVFYAFTGIGNFAFIFLSSIVTFFAARIAGTLNDRLKAKKQELSKEDFKLLVYELGYEVDLLDNKLNSIEIDKVLDKIGFPTNWKNIVDL